MSVIRRFIVALLLVVLLCNVAGAVQNAGPTWNSLASGYHFASYPAPSALTFEGAYQGDDFGADFAAIVNAVSEALSVRVPDIGGNDLLNASLENWPDQ